MFSCFNGLFGPEEKKRGVEEPSDSGGGRSPSWATLPVPVSNENLASWLPVSWLEENGRCVLFFHLGSFDLLSLELSGCTRRDLLFICEEKLAELQPQVSKISVVVDLHHVKLEQLNSHWWKILAPRLLQLVDRRFPEFLDELLFLRANRLSSLAAERLLNLSRPHLRDLIVLGGDEIAAQTFLESRGLGFVADCFFRDPTMTAVEQAQASRVRLRRRRRCCRFSLMTFLLLLVLFILESAGLPLSGAYLLLDLESWGRIHSVGLAFCLALAGWTWCPRLAVKDASPETMQLLILLLGSPLAWAAAYVGHAHYLIAAAAPALAVALAVLLIPSVPSKTVGKSQARRKDAWWPELTMGPGGEPLFMHAWKSTTAPRELPPMQADGRQLLARLMHLTTACRQVQLGSKQVVGDMVIQRIASQEGRAVWSAQVNQDPVMFVASEVHVCTSEPVEAVLWAIYSAEERMKWDSAAFKTYEVLGRQVQTSSQSLCDFLYCRVPLAPGVKDRDMVQERFLMKLPEEQGYAIAIQSCSAAQCSSLGLEVPQGVIRARTILSGYILRPHPNGGVVLTGVSQTDLGGSVPQWVQGFVKKAGKRMPLQWAERLQEYCNSRSSSPG